MILTWKVFILSMDKAIPILELNGTDFERGLMQGEQFADQIAELSELEAQDLKKATNLDDGALYAFADESLPIAEAYSPGLVQEMKGIAQGAGLPLQRIFTLNAFLDLYDLWIPENLVKMSIGCTSYGLNGDLTDDGNPLIGQNLDLHQRFQEYCILLRIPLENGGTALVYSFAGILGCVGVNSFGLCVVINKLFSWNGKNGVPYPMIIREFLGQSSFSLAVGSIVAADRASGMNYLVCNKHEIIDIEATATQSALLYPTEGGIFHTNNYVSEVLITEDAMPRLIQLDRAKANTYVRYAHLKRLFKNITSSGKAGINQLVEISRDHEDYPMGICHHSYTRWPEGTGRTVAAIIMRPEAGEMIITNGPPCEHDFITYSLDQ
jgi:isopenicillin-N N-acyltransferase-like protein